MAQPVESLCWRAPQPAKDWEGVREAYYLDHWPCSCTRRLILRTFILTISGQPAGVMSECAQLVSLKNGQVLQKSIIESGFFKSPYDRIAMQYSLEKTKKQVRNFSGNLV